MRRCENCKYWVPLWYDKIGPCRYDAPKRDAIKKCAVFPQTYCDTVCGKHDWVHSIDFTKVDWSKCHNA